MTEKKVIHEIKLDKSIKAILWAFVLAIMLNAAPKGMLVEDAMAELRNLDSLNVSLSGTVTVRDY